MRRLQLCVLIAILLTSCRTYYIGNNPASMLKNEQQAQGIALTSCQDTALNGLLYYLDFSNDYQLDRILKADVRGLKGFVTYAGTHILSTGKVLANYKKLKTGCSAFVCTAPNGDILLGRNFDFISDVPTPVVVCNTAPQDGYRSVSLISMSLLKYPKGSLSDGQTDVSLLATAPYLLMDGMNEKGLAICVLYLDPNDTTNKVWYGGTEQYDRHKHDIMTTIAMRLVLDRAASVDEALTLLNQYNMFANEKNPKSSYHFLLGDKSGKSIVLEYIPKEGKWVMSPVETNYTTNFYVHPNLYGIGHGHDRFEKLQQKLSETHSTLSETDAMSLLKNVSQVPTADKTSNTQWSVVYNLTKGTYSICVGRNYEQIIHNLISTQN